MEDEISLNFIHFNDVYDIDPEKGHGGVASFYTALQAYSNKTNPLVLFSGDVFSPSHCIICIFLKII